MLIYTCTPPLLAERFFNVQKSLPSCFFFQARTVPQAENIQMSIASDLFQQPSGYNCNNNRDLFQQPSGYNCNNNRDLFQQPSGYNCNNSRDLFQQPSGSNPKNKSFRAQEEPTQIRKAFGLNKSLRALTQTTEASEFRLTRKRNSEYCSLLWNVVSDFESSWVELVQSCRFRLELRLQG